MEVVAGNEILINANDSTVCQLADLHHNHRTEATWRTNGIVNAPDK